MAVTHMAEGSGPRDDSARWTSCPSVTPCTHSLQFLLLFRSVLLESGSRLVARLGGGSFLHLDEAAEVPLKLLGCTALTLVCDRDRDCDQEGGWEAGS